MSNPKLTSLQLQTAYRLAVQSSLVAFYQQNAQQAEVLVNRWWRTLSKVEDIQSGMFLHDEALSTAADLAHVREVPLTEAVRKHYQRILRESTQAALLKKRAPQRSEESELAEQQLG